LENSDKAKKSKFYFSILKTPSYAVVPLNPTSFEQDAKNLAREKVHATQVSGEREIM
jgi:hypothetical protein